MAVRVEEVHPMNETRRAWLEGARLSRPRKVIRPYTRIPLTDRGARSLADGDPLAEERIRQFGEVRRMLRGADMDVQTFGELNAMVRGRQFPEEVARVLADILPPRSPTAGFLIDTYRSELPNDAVERLRGRRMTRQ